MKKLIALLLMGILPLMASASGIGGGGSGVHGVGSHLPKKVGVGVSPYAWTSAYGGVIDIGDNGGFSSATSGQVMLWSNAYWNGTNIIYKNTNYAGYAGLESGSFSVHLCPSGTAGAAATCNLYFTIANDGTVTSGKSCASGYTRLTPNYCYFNNGHAGTILGTGTSGTVACPTGANAVMVNLDGKTGSTVGAASSDNLHAHQFVQVSSDYAEGIVPCNAGNWYWVSTVSSALNYVVLGYFD